MTSMTSTPAATPTVAICVATFRRPRLLRACLETLACLRFEKVPGTKPSVFVVDNDPSREGLEVVNALQAEYPWPLWGGHEPQRGISFARNALVHQARQHDFIAFIDDDETADPCWLDNLLSSAMETGAEAVLGPVRVRFEEPPSPTVRSLFVDPQLENGSAMPDGYFRTSSILLRTEALLAVPGPFDPAFALTGGSDYMLGQHLLARGARFVWAADALVEELVPTTRATLRWYLQRRYRTGMTYAKAQRVARGNLQGGLRGAYRGLGSLAVGARDLTRSLPNRKHDACTAVGLLMYGLGNLAGALGGHYEEYSTTHGS